MRHMGTRRKRRLRPILAFGTALSIMVGTALGGCENYLEESGARTVGEFTDDAAIGLIVKRRLIAARDVRGMRINVEVIKGVVTLIGRVHTEDERKRAIEIAAGVPNVAKVVDQLELP